LLHTAADLLFLPAFGVDAGEPAADNVHNLKGYVTDAERQNDDDNTQSGLFGFHCFLLKDGIFPMPNRI